MLWKNESLVSRLNQKYEKNIKKKGKSFVPPPFKTARVNVPVEDIISGMPCDGGEACVVCKFVQPAPELDPGPSPSPSKITKMSPMAIVSPSDKINKSNQEQGKVLA